MLRGMGARTVLGLRDVMDARTRCGVNGSEKAALPALRDLYDESGYTGWRSFIIPCGGLELTPEIEEKTIFTGYLKRPSVEDTSVRIDKPYILVSPGGGKDGEEMVEMALDALQLRRRLEVACWWCWARL